MLADAADNPPGGRVGNRFPAGSVGTAGSGPSSTAGRTMTKFLLWCILLVLCWPLALLALLLYPIVWLLLLPFRLLGIAVTGVFALLTAIIMFPARVLAGPRAL